MSTTYKGTINNDVLPKSGSPAGKDTLIGGKGNDTYHADAGDVVVEKPNEGIDQVLAVVGYTLPANVENLRLSGTASLNGTGNSLNNQLTGNGKANVLNGMGGKDTLLGGDGNDTLRVPDLKFGRLDGGQGTDTLELTGHGLTLNLAGLGNKLQNLEVIKLGADILTLTPDSVLALSSTSNTLRVIGTRDSTVELGSGWHSGADTVIGGVTYHSYGQGQANLQLSANIGAVPQPFAADTGSADLEASMARSVAQHSEQTGEYTGNSGNLRGTGNKPPSGFQFINQLLFSTEIIQSKGGVKYWGNEDGTITLITYQFADNAPTDDTAYAGSEFAGLKAGFIPLSSEQQAAAQAVMSAWATVVKVRFEANTVPDNPGDMRWFGSDSSTQVPTAFAFAPDSTALAEGAGDVWIGPEPKLSSGITPGSYGYLIYLHELGHALGLIHPQNSVYTPEAGTDSLKYTVMSYRDYAGDDLGGYNSDYFPTTPMLDDIAALQYLYGANTASHQGNDVYRWEAEKSVYETIWDSGGVDVIDAGNQSLGVSIDLNEAQWSRIGQPFWNGKATVRDCLTIARGVVIENAIGSTHDDTLIGNAAANRLTGNSGNDTLQGGAGVDIAVYAGNSDNYTVTFVDELTTTVKDNGVIDGDDGVDTLSGVEQLQFADRAISMLLINPADAAVKEGQSGQTVNVPVTLSETSPRTITVDYTTQNGTAKAGSDYVSQTGTLRFNPGTTQQTVQIQIIGDGVFEPDETLKLTFSNPANAQLGAIASSVTVQNDDPPPLTLAPLTVDENIADGMAVLTVQLAAASSDDVSVNYVTADDTAMAGGDYTATSGTLTIPAGQTRGAISIPLLDDNLVEADEKFSVRLSNPVNAVLGDAVVAAVTIKSDDPYRFMVGGNVLQLEGNNYAEDPLGSLVGGTLNIENNGAPDVPVTVKLSQTAPDILKVNYTTKSGSATAGIDYKETSGTLSFAPGEIEKTVLVPVFRDTEVEPDESFQFLLSKPVSLNPNIDVALGSLLSSTVMLQNDDFPKLSVRSASIFEDGGKATVLVTLSEAYLHSVTVDYATRDGTAIAGSDYVATRGSLTFAAGEVEKLIQIPIFDDTAVEGDESFQVLLSNPVNAELDSGFGTVSIGFELDQLPAPLSTNKLSVSTLNGSNGFRLTGANAGDYSGWSVSGAGDINGDGFADLMVGARDADINGENSGASYVVLGKASSFASSLSPSNLTGSNGFRLDGMAPNDLSGRWVSGAGDVNGDGLADMIIGALGADTNGLSAGSSYVVFGQTAEFAANINLSSLDSSRTGFRLEGAATGDYAGISVNGAGDVNGDGFDDMIVGAFGADASGGSDSGASYVVFGKAVAASSVRYLANMNGSNGFRLDGVAPKEQSGFPVHGAGDVNGDGFDDLIIGVYRNELKTDAGSCYVVFGKESGFASSMSLSSLNGGDGFRLDISAAGDDSSRSAVSSAGDVNNDGFDDLIIGARYADLNGSDSGASYVVFGKAGGFASSMNLSSLNGSNGFRLVGASSNDRSGTSVSGAGDVNADGFDDLIVGAVNADPGALDSVDDNNPGAGYVVFGKATGFASSMNLSSLNGSNGFRLDGAAGDKLGVSTSSAGDVDGDGFADLIIGAKNANPSGLNDAGTSYVLFGDNFTNAVNFFSGSSADSLSGTAAAERFVAGQGNDTLTGGGGADVLYGGAGDDIIGVADAGFQRIDGGGGLDTLALAGSELSFNLADLRGKIDAIEAIDLSGSGDNTLVMAALDVRNLSDTGNSLRVTGNTGDQYRFTDAGWIAGADVVLLGVTYHVFDNGTAHVLLNAALTAA